MLNSALLLTLSILVMTVCGVVHADDVLQTIEKQQSAESTGNEPLEGHARYPAAAIVALVPEKS